MPIFESLLSSEVLVFLVKLVVFRRWKVEYLYGGRMIEINVIHQGLDLVQKSCEVFEVEKVMYVNCWRN